MIDPLATAIAHLNRDADLRVLTGGRIAAKHKFGLDEAGDGARNGWPTPSQALTLGYDGGDTPDLYAGMRRARLEARCYGESQAAASAVYGRLMAVCDAFIRQPVPLSTGEAALMYWLVPDTSGQLDRDPDVGVDMIRVFLRCAVHQDAV